MKRNSGIATRTSFCMRKKVRCTTRSNTTNPRPRKPKVTPSDMSVNAVGNPIMIDTTMSEIMISPRSSGLTLELALLGEKRLGLLDVGEARRPDPCPHGDECASRFGDTLYRHEQRGDRDHGLERIERRRGRRCEGALVDGPRVRGPLRSDRDEREDGRPEREQIKHEVDAALHLDRP